MPNYSLCSLSLPSSIKCSDGSKNIPVARTVNQDTVVDEFVFTFTHDSIVDWMLPGVAPTNKKVEIPLIVVAKFVDKKVSSCRRAR